MQLPLFKSTDNVISLLQTKWKSIIDPYLSVPMSQGLQIKNIVISNGTAINVPHGLARMQQGWKLTDINGSGFIYKSAPFNSNYLTLTSSASAASLTISLWVW